MSTAHNSTSPLSFDELPRGAGGAGAAEQIAKTLNEQGVNAAATLYDEALALAREGKLAPASERLRMLLVLDPADADAALLLGKVLAARGQWQESLANLDTALAKGAILPEGLRDEVEGRLRAQVAESEDLRNQVTTRDKSEVRNLRAEAKRLRSENAAMELQVEELTRRVKLWSSATALVAGCASALLLAAMLFGGPSNDNPSPVMSPPVAPLVADASPSVSGDEGDAPTAVPVAAPVGAGTPTMTSVPVSAPTAAATPVAAPVVASATPTPASTTVAPTATPVKASAPAAAPTKPGPKLATKPAAKAAGLAPRATHTVRSGDTLGSIALKYYGDSSQWKGIVSANSDTLHGSKNLQPGMKLKIPRLPPVNAKKK